MYNKSFNPREIFHVDRSKPVACTSVSWPHRKLATHIIASDFNDVTVFLSCLASTGSDTLFTCISAPECAEDILAQFCWKLPSFRGCIFI